MLACFAKDVSQYGLHTAEELEKMLAKNCSAPSASIMIASPSVESSSRKRKSLSPSLEDVVSPSKRIKTSGTTPASRHRRAVSDSPMIIARLKDWMSPMKRRRKPRAPTSSRTRKKVKNRLVQRVRSESNWSITTDTPDKRNENSSRNANERNWDGGVAAECGSPPVTECTFAVEMKTYLVKTPLEVREGKQE